MDHGNGMHLGVMGHWVTLRWRHWGECISQITRFGDSERALEGHWENWEDYTGRTLQDWEDTGSIGKTLEH